MTTATNNYGWLMPDPGGSANTWGNILNGTTQAIDAKMWSLNAQLDINGLTISRGPDGGNWGQIVFNNNGNTQPRWVLGESSETEGSGNTGTNFYLNAYDNSGAYLGNVFEAIRGTQNVTFQEAVTVGAVLTVDGALTANAGLNVTGNADVSGQVVAGTQIYPAWINAPDWYLTQGGGYRLNNWAANWADRWNTANGTRDWLGPSGDLMTLDGLGNLTTAGSLVVNQGSVNIHVGSATNPTLYLNNNTANVGAVYSSSNTMVVQNLVGGGEITITSDGNAHTSGGLIVSGGITGLSGNLNVQAQSGGNSNCWFVRNDGTNMGVVYYDNTNQLMLMQNQVGGGWARIDGATNFQVSAGAIKPGGGSWSAPSDERIKTVTGEYTAGLSEVLRLHPVSYRYKGNDASPGELSPTKHIEDKQFVGFVAQELEQIMPDMVSRREGYVDGRKVTDLRDVDVSSLVFALVNAVKGLKAEIEALKAGR